MAVKQKSPNPQKMYPIPPYPEQEQTPPGNESEMDPRPEFGKETYTGSGKLQDKVALITGGDSGIGRAVATLYAKEGADIAIAYLSEDEDAEETRRVVEEQGRRCILFPGDIGEKAHCQTIVDEVVDHFGSIDILVNNAAYQKSVKSITELTEEDLERTFRTNIYAMFFLTQLALPHMNTGGSIINTASIQAFQPSPNLISYAATKAAIVNFSRALSQEVTPKGIRVNSVAPGPVWTPLIPSTLGKEKTKNFGKDSLFGRAAQPIELAPLYVFLASSEASYVSGQVYGTTGAALP